MGTTFLQTSSLYKVYSTLEKEAWNSYVSRSFVFDFYHTCDYHLMDSQGDPFLFVYEKDDIFLAIPLIKRKIDGAPYFDCTCVYGYTGPLTNMDFSELPADIIDDFISKLTIYFKSQGIISVFCVLHPLLNQSLLLNATDGLVNVGKTVAIDLRISLEEQIAQYRRPIRMKVNQLRNKGFEIRLIDTENQLNQFADIYRENMTKVGASERYLFDNTYFNKFMNATDFKTELLAAYYQDKMVAGAMVVLTNNIMQLHLAGTSSEFRKESPMKLIFDEACLLGRKRGMHFMHLGSGVGGKEDSLFHFKQGFSENTFDFTTWRYIVDKKIYNELVQSKLDGNEAPNTDLFPLYRFI